MKKHLTKQKILEYLCNLPEKPSIGASETALKISTDLGLKYSLVEVYLLEMQDEKLLEAKNVSHPPVTNYKVNVKPKIYSFLEEGGYVELQKIIDLDFELKNSQIRTNGATRLSIYITLFIILIGVFFQIKTCTITDSQLSISKEQLRIDTVSQKKNSEEWFYLKSKIDSIQEQVYKLKKK
jgi:hypothetical protein